MGRAVGYVRETGEGESLRAEQEEAIHALAESQGLDLIRVSSDDATADPIAQRPGLAEALDSLEPGMTLLIYDLESMATDLLAQELYLRDVRNKGASVVTCSPDDAEYLGDDAQSLASGLDLP